MRGVVRGERGSVAAVAQAREVLWCLASAEKLAAVGWTGRCGDFTPSTGGAFRTDCGLKI